MTIGSTRTVGERGSVTVGEDRLGPLVTCVEHSGVAVAAGHPMADGTWMGEPSPVHEARMGNPES